MGNKLLLKNAKLVVNDSKILMDGAIVLNNGLIEDVYAGQYQKRIKGFEGKQIDMHGLILMPAMVNINQVSSRVSEGVGAYLKVVIGPNFVQTIKEYTDCIGLRYENQGVLGREELHYINRNQKLKMVSLVPDLQSPQILKELRDRNIKMAVIRSKLEAWELKALRFNLLAEYMKHDSSVDFKTRKLNNIPFIDDYFMVEMDINEEFDDMMLKIMIDKLGPRHIIVASEDMAKAFKRLLNMGYQLNEVAAMTSLNAYRYLDLDTRLGSLQKGKVANMNVVKEDGTIVTQIKYEE